MSWFAGTDLHLEFLPNGSIKNLFYKGQPLWAIGESFLPTVELAISLGQRRVVVQPFITADSVQNQGSSLTVNFDTCLGLRDSIKWSIAGRYTMEISEDGTIYWRVRIKNDCPHSICEVLYPRTMPVYLSSTGVLMYPHHAGERIENVPHALASEKYQRFWRAESVPTDFGFAREINYCGLASMTWMDISDGLVGMYVGSHDPNFPVTGLRIETGGPDDPWVSLSIRKYVDIPSGESYDSSEVVWAFHEGDWHLSAHRYRAWFDTVVKQTTHPEDLKDEVVVSPHYNFKRFEGIGYRFTDIPQLARGDRKDFNSRHFLIAGWNHMGFDSHYPNYNPDLDLGTPLVLQEGVELINSSGGFVTFYINARIMDKYSEYARTLGEEWMLRTVEQVAVEEQYGPAETFVLCPSHPGWREHLKQFALWMCKAYGARGIYYDQLGSATPYPCYSRHIHGPYSGSNEFNRNYVDLIENTLGAMQEIREDSFLMIENCGDIYSSRVWGSLAWNGPDYDEFFNLYKYTFPEHTMINMVNPRHLDNGELQEQFFYRDLARAFLLGSVWWFEGNNVRLRPRNKESQARIEKQLHEALVVRNQATPYISNAIFNDDVALTVPLGVQATVWRFVDGQGGFVLVVNDDFKPHQIIVAMEGAEDLVIESFGSSNQEWITQEVTDCARDLFLEIPKSRFSLISWKRM